MLSMLYPPFHCPLVPLFYYYLAFITNGHVCCNCHYNIYDIMPSFRTEQLNSSDGSGSKEVVDLLPNPTCIAIKIRHII